MAVVPLPVAAWVVGRTPRPAVLLLLAVAIMMARPGQVTAAAPATFTATQIVCGVSHTCAVSAAKTVTCWGAGFSGEYVLSVFLLCYPAGCFYTVWFGDHVCGP